MEIENESALAAQAHFGLAGLYRKQGKAAEAQREMREFQRLRTGTKPGKGTSTLGREFVANTESPPVRDCDLRTIALTDQQTHTGREAHPAERACNVKRILR